MYDRMIEKANPAEIPDLTNFLNVLRHCKVDGYISIRTRTKLSERINKVFKEDQYKGEIEMLSFD